MLDETVVKGIEHSQRYLVRGQVVAVESETLYGVAVRNGEEEWMVVADLLVTSQAGVQLRAGDSVLCWLENGDRGRGVILGRIAPAEVDTDDEQVATIPREEDGTAAPAELVIQAHQSLTLRVGEASITIREDGKILIKGKDLVSHAQRMNRIKGGAVSIN